MATQQLWEGRPRELENGDIYNRIDMNVRARYTYIDGVRYVESLSSSPYAEGELVVDPATSSTIDTIHVLEDHIGVRRIPFSSTEHSQKLESFLSTPVRDTWWRNIPFSTTVFYANFDGVKLRGIKIDGRGPCPVPSAAMQGQSTSEDVAWPRPMYPANEPVLHYSNLNNWEIEEERRNAEITPWTPFTRYRFRTVSFDCNDPAVTGYSVCFMSGIRGIYAHRGEDVEMYNDVDMCTRKGIWMHMPVDPDDAVASHALPCPSTATFFAVSLDNVAQITPCGREVRFQDGNYWVITGIMVHYADGHRVCAGEFRVDCAGESMRVDNTSMLLLGFYVEKNETAGRWLAAIEDEPTDDDGFLTWRSLRYRGTLQWWFDEHGRCQIFRRDGMGQLSRV